MLQPAAAAASPDVEQEPKQELMVETRSYSTRLILSSAESEAFRTQAKAKAACGQETQDLTHLTKALVSRDILAAHVSLQRRTLGSSLLALTKFP